MLPLFVHGELMGRNQKQKNPNKVFVSTGWCVEVFFNEAVNWQKPFFYSNNSDIDCFFFSDFSLPVYRWGANWCCGMQLCWLLICQGAKSKGVSFVNYTQCYKQSCSFEPFLSSASHKYFGSGTKRKKENNLHTIITVGRADCLQMFVWIIMGAEAGLP